jgi:hypothetical protein
MQRREAKSVARIEPLFWKFPPRFDMAGNEQTRNVDAADAATNFISRKHRLPEELLSAPDFYRRLCFSRAGWRNKMNFVALEKIHFFRFIFREQIVQQLLTFNAEFNDVGLEFLPQSPILVCCSRHSNDATRLQNRIERCKVAQLDSQTACRSTHLRCDFLYDWIVLMELPKRKFAIKIQRDEPMFSCPFHSRSFCHAATLPDSIPIAKREKCLPCATNLARYFC